MKIGLEILQQQRIMCWGDIGGCWSEAFYLPNEKFYKQIFTGEAMDFLKTAETGIYERCRMISDTPLGKGKPFPLQVSAHLTISAMHVGDHMVPGKVMITELSSSNFAAVLTRDDGEKTPVFINYAYRNMLDLSQWIYQGSDPLGPIVILKDAPLSFPARVSLTDTMAMIWPLDLRTYKDES